MSDIRYNFVALEAAAEDCASNVRNMNGRLESLKGDIQPLLATWEGDAKEAYFTRQGEWEAAASDLTTLLGRIEKALRLSAEKMRARELANKHKVSGGRA